MKTDSKNKLSLSGEARSIFGRKVKNLRREDKIPSNIFGKKIESKAIQIGAKDFQEVYKEAGETGLIELAIGSDKRPVLVHNIQSNPKTDEILHVDFLQVDLKEKVEANVPVELTGESPAEKQSLGTVVLHLNQITVSALPTDLPEKFEVDISEMAEVDQIVSVKDLKYDTGKVEILSEPDDIVAKVEPPQKIEEEPAPAPEEGEVSVEGEAVAEGETPGQTPEAPTEEAK